MMKRKVALLMTTVMLATSVFPSGITAYAEDAVLTGETAAEVTLDGTEEEPADVSSVDDDVDVPDEIAGTEADSAQTEGAVQETGDELQPDAFVEEEIGVDETAQGNLASEEDDGFVIDDIEVVDEVDSLSAAEPDSGVAITNVTFSPTKTSFEIETGADDIYNALQAVVTYSDSTSEVISSWTIVNQEEGTFSYLYVDTRGGRIFASMWNEDNSIFESNRLGECTVVFSDSVITGLEDKGHIYATQKITIEKPRYESVFTPGKLMEYSVIMGTPKWYGVESFEAGNHILEVSEKNVAIILFQIEEGILRQVASINSYWDDNTRFHFLAQEGVEYLLRISTSGYSEEATGTLSEVPPREIKSVEFSTESMTIDVTELESKFRYMPVTVTYANGDKETVPFQSDIWLEDFSDGKQCLRAETLDGKKVSLSLWNGDQQVDTPNSLILPVGKLTLKVFIEDKEWARLPVTIDDTKIGDLPEKLEVPTYTQGDFTGYHIPAQSDERRLRVVLQETEDGVGSEAIYLYRKEKDRYINSTQRVLLPGENTLLILDAGQEYMLISRSYTEGTPHVVAFSMEQKKNVQSVKLVPETSYNTFTLSEELLNLSASVIYDSGEELIDDTWCSEWDDNEYQILKNTTENGNTVTVSFWDGEGQINMPSLDELFIGNLTLKVAVDGKEMAGSAVTVEVMVPETEAILQEKTPYSFDSGRTMLYFAIQGQETAKALRVSCGENSQGYGSVSTILCRTDKETGNLVRVSGSEYADLEEDAYYRLNVGDEYLLVLRSQGMFPCSGEITLEDQKGITLITLEGLNSSYDVAGTGGILENVEISVTYEDEEQTRVSDLYEDWDDDDICYYYGETQYGDTVEVRLKNAKGSVIGIPYSSSRILLPGTYTLVLSTDAASEKQWEETFEVEYSETIENLALNINYPVVLDEGKGKLFRFIPTESGYYIFSSATTDNVDKNSIAMLYNSDSGYLNHVDDGEWGEDFTLAYGLTKGQTYYYFVGGYDREATSTTVRLVKVPGIKTITMEAEPTNTTYILDQWDEAYTDCSGMKTRILYTDGSNEVVDGRDYDKYDNYVHTEIYPLDKSGKPDMNQESYDDSYVYEPGSYALFSAVNYWIGDDFVTVRSSTWVKIVVAEYGHVHTKETTQRIEKSPTCTTAGRKATYCSTCGGRLSGTAAVIPATGHKWGSWTVTKKADIYGPEIQTGKCEYCKIVSTRTVGSKLEPVLTLTANKLTMKTKQSTSKFKVTAMTAGDSLASVTSNNTKLLKVSNINPNGTFKLKAQNKTGTAKLTITLKSGASRTIKVKIQKAKVKTTKVKAASKKLTLSKKQKYDLAPVVTPVTSYDKLKCTTSNKKVATVSKKGVVTAKAKGKATITITSGKKKVKVKVTVK